MTGTKGMYLGRGDMAREPFVIFGSGAVRLDWLGASGVVLCGLTGGLDPAHH
jgi:hypothetical protein